MLDIYATFRDILQTLRSLKISVALSQFETDVAPSKGNSVYGEILHTPIRLYLYVPP